MARLKPGALRELKTEELEQKLTLLTEERFRLAFRRATEAIPNPLQLRTIRRDMARIQTIHTPILIITNGLDYRVPEGEGLQMFTAVQRMGVESKLIDFPDEGHWVLKPANSVFWYDNVIGWLDKHLK